MEGGGSLGTARTCSSHVASVTRTCVTYGYNWNIFMLRVEIPEHNEKNKKIV